MQRHMAVQFTTREGTTEPYPFRDVGSFTCPVMALPVHGTSIYSMMRTAPYSVLSMPSAWQGSSMYHFYGDWYHPAADSNPQLTTHKASTLTMSHWLLLMIFISSFISFQRMWGFLRPQHHGEMWHMECHGITSTVTSTLFYQVPISQLTTKDNYKIRLVYLDDD